MPTDDPIESLETRDKLILAALVQEFSRPEEVHEFVRDTRQRAKDYDRLIWLFRGVRIVAQWAAVVAAGWAVFKGWIPSGDR